MRMIMKTNIRGISMITNSGNQKNKIARMMKTINKNQMNPEET
jgi:hypothetical protein